jgi:hypothetical protein
MAFSSAGSAALVDLGMHYTVRIFHSDEVTEGERAAAAQRFRAALEAELGDASLVLPVYRAYLKLLQAHGEHARPWDLAPAEQLLADQWEAAELAATRAAFGAERYMGDAHFELEMAPT